MSFVPFVPVVTPPPPPSPEAQELGRRLAETIESFKREHPEMRDFEIRQAMRLAMAGRRAVPPAAAVLIGLVVALGVGGSLLLSSRPEGEVAVPVVVLVVMALVVGIVVFRIKNR